MFETTRDYTRDDIAALLSLYHAVAGGRFSDQYVGIIADQLRAEPDRARFYEWRIPTNYPQSKLIIERTWRDPRYLPALDPNLTRQRAADDALVEEFRTRTLVYLDARGKA